MKSARYTQGEGLRFIEVAQPQIEAGDLLLRVEAAGICGTDVKIAGNGHRKLASGQTVTLGHEFVGTILESRDSRWKPGQRVGVAPNLGCGACEMCSRGLMNMCPDYTAFGITFDGAHAAFLRVPKLAIAQNCVVALAANADPLKFVMAEPLSCALNSMRAVGLKLGDTALIYGAGPMGLLNAMLAAAAGCALVIVVDRNADRLVLAQELGATDTIDNSTTNVTDWVMQHTQKRGVDVVVTAVPAAAVQQEALGILAPYGRLSLFAGLPRGASDVPIDTNAIHYKNLVVTGTTGGSSADYRIAVQLIESGRVNVRRLVSHVYSFDQIDEAYRTAMTGKSMKVVIADEGLIR